ncbi:MAG: hypothetical protein ABI697_04095 [Devosia sp.]
MLYPSGDASATTDRAGSILSLDGKRSDVFEVCRQIGKGATHRVALNVGGGHRPYSAMR